MASMAEAIGMGMRATSWPSGLTSAVAIISKAATMKAPTAAFMPTPDEAAIRAAPGVDQAQMMGIR